jgi:hypothetical protein
MQTDGNQNEIALYATPDGSIKLDVRIDAETVWLTQRQMAELFGTTVFNVNVHLKNIYETHELGEAATIEEFSIVRREGTREVKRQIKHYNLDAIIGVGYRVNSKRGTQFRIWATQRLREHLVKGFTVNKTRLEQRGLVEIENTVKLLGRTLNAHGLIGDEGQALLDLVEHYTRSAESRFTQMWRRARRISFILSLRTIPSPTATSASAACYFCTTSTKTGGSLGSTGSRASTTALLWRWRFSLPKALLVRRTAWSV